MLSVTWTTEGKRAQIAHLGLCCYASLLLMVAAGSRVGNRDDVSMKFQGMEIVWEAGLSRWKWQN